MKNYLILLLITIVVISGCATKKNTLQSNGEKSGLSLLMVVQNVIDEQSILPDKVQESCSLDNVSFGSALFNAVKKNVEGVERFDKSAPKNIPVLNVHLIDLFARGGGGWTGPKSMRLRAEIEVNGVVVNATTITSRGRGILKGTCQIVEGDLTKDMSKKLGDWVLKMQRRNYKADVRNDHLSLALLSKAQFLDKEKVPLKVLDECNIDSVLVGRALERLERHYPGIPLISSEENAKGRYLKLNVIEIIAPPGGSASGKKSISLNVQLIENGKVIDSITRFKQAGGGGIFGQVFRGACDFLDGLSAHLAVEIVKWMTKADEQRMWENMKSTGEHPFMSNRHNIIISVIRKSIKNGGARPLDYDFAAERLIQDYRNKDLDDLMAWFCRLLEHSESIRYKNVLNEVNKNTESSKLRRYTKSALKELVDDKAPSYHKGDVFKTEDTKNNGSVIVD